ncbi:unnamed protein product [Auanema sp. JU1783]|nr:unnamed protein product [Auanema sp. JU1783]
MYLRVISQCPKDLSFTNYGATFGLEIVRRMVVPRLNFETCYDVTKDTSKWPITVELAEQPYCGLTEM